MKTLGQIIDEVKQGLKPDYEDLRYAVCAMDALMVFDRNAIWKLAEAESENKKPVLVYSAVFQRDENFRRIKTAMNITPKQYVGPNNDPDSPEVQKRRKASQNLMSKVMSKNS